MQRSQLGSNSIHPSIKCECFAAVRKPDEYDIIRKRCLEINPTIQQDKLGNGRTFFYEMKNLKVRKLPEGLRIGELNSSHAAHVKANWAWADEHNGRFIDYLLDRRNGFPNSAVFDGQRPVAHTLYTGDGSLGVGFVDPAYQRQGLFQQVLYNLVAKMTALGHNLLYGYVAHENIPSAGAMLQMGAVEGFAVDSITASPALVTPQKPLVRSLLRNMDNGTVENMERTITRTALGANMQQRTPPK